MQEKFEAAINDDLNTSVALSVIFELVRLSNSLIEDLNATASTLTEVDDMFNLLGGDCLDPALLYQPIEEALRKARTEALVVDSSLSEVDRSTLVIDVLGVVIHGSNLVPRHAPNGATLSPADISPFSGPGRPHVVLATLMGTQTHPSRGPGDHMWCWQPWVLRVGGCPSLRRLE